MRKDKYMTNGDLEQGRIMKKLEEVNNEQTAIKMLEYSIVGNYPNIYELKGEYNGKNSSRTVKKEYAESTYDRLKRERDERRQREKQEREGYQEPEIEDDPNDNFPF